MPARLGNVVAVLDDLYPPSTAESWDAVGLVCGDPEAAVRRILFAIDPVLAVADEAVAGGFDLLVTHHPLFLRAVHGVAATTPKGLVVHRLLSSGVALHVAHTNADVASPGVSDALADTIGLADIEPLQTQYDDVDKVVTFVPHDGAQRLLDALSGAGAGAIGNYSRCAWTAAGLGTFRPEPGANPTIGSLGAIEEVPETRIEMVLPRARRTDVVRALLAAHPYELPAYDVYELASLPSDRGLGRIGVLPQPEPLREFARRVGRALPATAAGVRVSGNPARPVQTVAVCGGAGDSLLTEVRRREVDVYVTADLRHHPASEHAEADGPALVDAAHWATEWPWLQHAARDVTQRLGAQTGTTVEAVVSTAVTDPWPCTSTRSRPPDRERRPRSSAASAGSAGSRHHVGPVAPPP